MNDVPWVWMNGELRAWEDATVHIGTHALHYGTAVFEGVRAYATPRGPGVFRLGTHLDRFVTSGKCYEMELPYANDELVAGVWQLLDANKLDACYIRPIAWRGFRQLGLYPLNNPVEVAILVWPWGTYHGDDALEQGVDVTISSVRRFDPAMLPSQAKASGHYLNSILAKLEAERAGCAEAIMLNSAGRVAEASAENVFVVKDGAVRTPPLTESILPGITRDTVLLMCRDLEIPCEETPLLPADLTSADELFLTGTAAEITPVRAVDGHVLGPRGPITSELQRLYLATVRGEATPWASLVDYGPKASGAGGQLAG